MTMGKSLCWRWFFTISDVCRVSREELVFETPHSFPKESSHFLNCLFWSSGGKAGRGAWRQVEAMASGMKVWKVYENSSRDNNDCEMCLESQKTGDRDSSLKFSRMAYIKRDLKLLWASDSRQTKKSQFLLLFHREGRRRDEKRLTRNFN